MRMVVQRVSSASVAVEGSIVGKIGHGLLVLLGIHKDDAPEMTYGMVKKLLNLRIFEDERGKINLSLKDIKGEVLVVSQFTLYGNCSHGRRPDFLQAAPGAQAEPIYRKFSQEVSDEVGDVQMGVFGAYMKISLVNEGPVTVILESNKIL